MSQTSSGILEIITQAILILKPFQILAQLVRIMVTSQPSNSCVDVIHVWKIRRNADGFVAWPSVWIAHQEQNSHGELGNQATTRNFALGCVAPLPDYLHVLKSLFMSMLNWFLMAGGYWFFLELLWVLYDDPYIGPMMMIAGVTLNAVKCKDRMGTVEIPQRS